MFSKSILATTLALFSSTVVGQLINIEYGYSPSGETYTQQLQLKEFTKLEYPGTYTYFSSPDPCDLYSNAVSDPAYFGAEGQTYFDQTYLEYVYCYESYD
ncbi:uncharacterized protein BO80DRAFT_426319 [Aspergillus ibericus CBS 121593]|uniref:Uncharacterized protein n=1 Tax=Aspergillus ibericus CBS 121593 TaxID=1448316 RepID=A0A395GW33_9EURO|nr:hypothetical protein BO80DRAFT_426319 [Aspergillus ibericus CBS 121593]RAK99632.1 hypothetical protein BO80DRAFT_426319 [Aspergillus ibericus CBS 121593]